MNAQIMKIYQFPVNQSLTLIRNLYSNIHVKLSVAVCADVIPI